LALTKHLPTARKLRPNAHADFDGWRGMRPQFSYHGYPFLVRQATPMHDRRNVELKARLASLDAARQTADNICTKRLPDQVQVDTYFHCRQGRLKLREIDGQQAELVWYERPNQHQARTSRYQLVTVSQPAELKAALAAALGVRCEVTKRRAIYLHHNVRIHIDEVSGLGTFLEFEAMLIDGVDQPRAQEQVRSLSTEFQLQPSQLIDSSYADLILAASQEGDTG
jgi:predicted adenylyl cyclase CyaB